MAEWKLVARDLASADGLASDNNGDVVFRGGVKPALHRITADDKVKSFTLIDGPADALAFGPDGRWYAADAKGSRRRRNGSREICRGVYRI